MAYPDDNTGGQYPGAVSDTTDFPQRSTGQVVEASHMNLVQQEVIQIEKALGVGYSTSVEAILRGREWDNGTETYTDYRLTGGLAKRLSDVDLAIANYRAHRTANDNVHGIGSGSSVVGTTTIQNIENKTLIAPVISSLKKTGAGNTITVPTPTNADTLVLVDEQQTLTQKTLTSPVLTTPVLASFYQVSGGGLISVPASGTATNVVLENATQTLSSKSLNSPTLNTPAFSGPVSTDIELGAGKGIIFEGTTADNFETTLVAGDPTADRTVTLPNATDTLVGKNTTDELTNKTLGASNNIKANTTLTNNGTISGGTISGVTLSGTTTNTGATISGGTISGATLTASTLTTPIISTFYKASGGNLITVPTPSNADTVALVNQTQTLTGKTLTNPVISTTTPATTAGSIGYSNNTYYGATGGSVNTVFPSFHYRRLAANVGYEENTTSAKYFLFSSGSTTGTTLGSLTNARFNIDNNRTYEVEMLFTIQWTESVTTTSTRTATKYFGLYSATSGSFRFDGFGVGVTGGEYINLNTSNPEALFSSNTYSGVNPDSNFFSYGVFVKGTLYGQASSTVTPYFVVDWSTNSSCKTQNFTVLRGAYCKITEIPNSDYVIGDWTGT